MDISSTRTGELVVDATLFEDVFNNYTWIPPPINPFNQMIGFNPFRPLTTPN
jgi:hypothetical protein